MISAAVSSTALAASAQPAGANERINVGLIGTGTNGNLVQGNMIGLNAAGTTRIGNDQFGVYIQGGASGNRIGTNGDGVNDANERNVISGNAIDGIRVESVTTTNTIHAATTTTIRVAHAGRRLAHFTTRSPSREGRAVIGSPFRKCRKSSAKCWAVG